MSTYTIEQHPSLPAVIATWHQDSDFNRDAQAMSAAMRLLLENSPSPIFYILDVSTCHDITFNELREATQIAAGSPHSNFHHMMNAGTLVITKNPAIKLTAEGLRSKAYGEVNVMVYPNINDALSFARENAA